MTHYLCLKDLAYIWKYSDGSNFQELTDWLIVHASHNKLVALEEFTTGVAKPA